MPGRELHTEAAERQMCTWPWRATWKGHREPVISLPLPMGGSNVSKAMWGAGEHRQSKCPGAQWAGLSARKSPLGPCFPFSGTSHPLPLLLLRPPCQASSTATNGRLLIWSSHPPLSGHPDTCPPPLSGEPTAPTPSRARAKLTNQRPGFHFLYSQDSSFSQ